MSNVPGLAKPWVWVQPKDRAELIQRLLEAREYAVPERERENLCSMAYEALRSTATPAMEKMLRDLLDRAYKMMEMAGYKVVEQNPDHNNPIIAWMADARTLLYGSGPQPDMERDLHSRLERRNR